MFYNYNSEMPPSSIFKSCIIPRPIAWISTISKEGITNLAPFSYFQAISDSPPMIMFVASPKTMDNSVKDTARNIEDTKEFVVNIVSDADKELMMLSSSVLPYNESEIDKFQIPTKQSQIVKAPSISISKINLECQHVKTIDIENNKMVIGKIVGIYIDDAILDDGKINVQKLAPLCRLGYDQYSVIEKVLHLKRPYTKLQS